MHLCIPVNNFDQIQGDKQSTVLLLEYGDYACPHSNAVYPIVKKLERHFFNRVQFVFRNFPLATIHPYAMEAACAAEASARQNKFWLMHDLIFENQQMLSSAQLLNFGRGIGLDIEKLVEDMRSKTVISKIESDMEGGIRSGVNQTPTFFINGVKYDLDLSYESIHRRIAELL